jgi:hypothetical protein
MCIWGAMFDGLLIGSIDVICVCVCVGGWMKAYWRVVSSPSSFFLLLLRPRLFPFSLLWAMLQEADSSDEKLPMTGRLTPIGGASSDTEYGRRYADRNNPRSHLTVRWIFSANEEFDDKFVMLEEHDRLNKSLSALTRHFAHVQLRLQQVVSAPTSEDREVC